MSYSSSLKEYLESIEIKKDCCKKAYRAGLELKETDEVCEADRGLYLRGVFVACGSMTDPEKQYNVTFSGEGADIAESALISCGVFPHRGVRKGREIVYIREFDGISDFLTSVGAQKFTLRLMEINVMRDTMREVNRKTNAELANMDKTATASAEVREAIGKIKAHRDFEKLPEDLKETAELRLANPAMSLDELRMLHGKPISKSGLCHRLKRLTEAAERYGD